MGSPVRRFRQRRAGGVRSVYLIGRAQVAASVRSRLPSATRLRGAGAGTFERTTRAFSATVRGRQHAGGKPHDACELYPCLAPAIEAGDSQAADPDDAEKP